MKIINFFLGIIIIVFTIFFETSLFTDTQLLGKWYIYAGFSFIWSYFFFIFTKKITLTVNSFSLTIFLLLIYVLIRGLLSHTINIFILSPICFLLLFIIFQSLKPSNTNYLKKTIIIVCLFQGIYGLLQFIDVINTPSTFSIIGTFDNPAGYAVSLSASLPICLSEIRKNGIWKILTIITSVVIVVTVFLSESRTGVICCIAAIMLSIISSLKWKYKKIYLLLCGVLLIYLMIAFSIYFKKDSSSGRLLIWNNSMKMIKESPIFGLGHGSFEGKYMNYQAKYFQDNPNSEFSMLADNVKHPFNEYLLLLIQYGIVGLILFILIVLSVLINLREIFSNTYFHCIIIVGIFALFSYPLTYSYILFLLAFCSGNLVSNISNGNLRILSLWIRILIVFFISGCSYWLLKDITFEYSWNRVVKAYRFVPNSKIIEEYKKLYVNWNGNYYFLDNYGSFLNSNDNYLESNQVLLECEKYFNDYDIQLQIGFNYFYLENWDEALNRFQTALNMCPNRFRPLYQIYQIYSKIGDEEKALEIANLIINKSEKIPSGFIWSIKSEMKKKIASDTTTITLTVE